MLHPRYHLKSSLDLHATLPPSRLLSTSVVSRPTQHALAQLSKASPYPTAGVSRKTLADQDGPNDANGKKEDGHGPVNAAAAYERNRTPWDPIGCGRLCSAVLCTR